MDKENLEEMRSDVISFVTGCAEAIINSKEFKYSEASKRRWENPEFRCKLIVKHIVRCQTPEWRYDFLNIVSPAAFTPESIQKAIESRKSYNDTEKGIEDRVNQSIRMKEFLKTEKGQEWINKFSFKNPDQLHLAQVAFKNPDVLQKRSLSHKAFCQTEKGKDQIKKAKEASLTPESIEKAKQSRSRRGKYRYRRAAPTSIFKGVRWRLELQLWVATVKSKHVGFYKEEIDAARAYNVEALQILGEDTYLNPIPSLYDGKPINKHTHAIGPSGYRGVSWSKRGKNWRASIRAGTKVINLGGFVNKMDAVKAWNTASLKYRGPGSYQNPIPES